MSGGTIEKPLYVGYPGLGTLVMMCRLRKRQIPTEISFAFGNLATVTALFTALDPRLYGATKATVSGPSIPASSMKFPLTFPFSFGGGSFISSVKLTNSGDFETRPRIIIEGPMVYPRVWAGENILAFDIELEAGAKLELDTDLHTATYYGPGSTVGEAALSTIVPGSEWFTLQPGETTVYWTSSSYNMGQVTYEVASAHLL